MVHPLIWWVMHSLNLGFIGWVQCVHGCKFLVALICLRFEFGPFGQRLIAYDRRFSD